MTEETLLHAVLATPPNQWAALLDEADAGPLSEHSWRRQAPAYPLD